MNNDWIMFYSNGNVVVDVSLGVFKDTSYPYGTHDITPHHGKVPASSIIERRVKKHEI